MISNIKATFKDINAHGMGVACLEFYLETNDAAFRDKVQQRILEALAGVTLVEEDEKEQKQGALGFHQPGEEDGE